MTGPATIRAPRPDEAAEIAAMVDELSAHEGEERGRFTADAARRDILSPDAPLSCRVAEAEGRLVGLAIWHFAYETADAARGSFLTDLYVREDRRKQGVGRALIAAVAAETRAAGGEFVWWTAYASNEAARAWYRKLADEETGLVAFALTFDGFAKLADEG